LPSRGGGASPLAAVAWRRGAAKLGGEHGVATTVEARPPLGGGSGAPAVATSSGLARLRWAWAGLVGLARDSRLRMAPGRLLGVVARRLPAR
jgi:hypothetical protein